MIVIGYQGIGKSSLCKKHRGEGYIDLESSLMKDPMRGNERWDNWEEIYCNIALSLSDQGYTVFISSHSRVQRFMEKALAAGAAPVIAVYPSLDIREDWIARLLVRWKETGRKKDEIAYLDAKAHYDEEIMKLRNIQVARCEIDSMIYDLKTIIEEEKCKWQR